MPRTWILLFAVSLFQFATAFGGLADDAAEKMVDEALPLMHYSCKSVVDENKNDPAAIDAIVSKLLAVSLYNHAVDISKHAKSEAEKTALRDRFVAKLTDECTNDKEALLAGAIDDALVHALKAK